MLGLISRRLAQLPIILVVIYTLTLALAWAVPGNPLEKGDRRPPEVVVQAMQKQYNLDNFWAFYFTYLSNVSGVQWLSDEITGKAELDAKIAVDAGGHPPIRRVFDMGPSLMYEDWRVNEIVAGSLPVSATLGLIAILIALVLGVVTGIVGAVRPNSLLDLATLIVALVGISLPTFVIGTVILIAFSVWIPLFPVGEWGPPGALLPALTLSLPFAAYIARLTRMGMIEVLGADYIRTARAKGVSESRVLLKHALKNAFLPVLSYLGPAAALAMTGSFVVERVFNISGGMGQHFVNAVLNKDLFLIMGVVLVYATMLILFNLVVDVLYRWVDPRIA